MVELQPYAESRGLDVSSWSLEEATGLSADGRQIVGNGQFMGRTRGWLITHLPEPCIGASHYLRPQTVCASQAATFVAPLVGRSPIHYSWEVSSSPNGPWISIINGLNLGPDGSPAFMASGAFESKLVVDQTSRIPQAWGTSHIYFRARGTNDCDSAIGRPALLRVCLSDLNCDASTDLSDFFRFFNCFDQSDLCADIDQSGEVDLIDFFAFLNAFDQSC